MIPDDIFAHGTTTRTEIARVAPNLVEAARAISTATLHEAGGRIGALPRELKPVVPHLGVAGPAITVHSPGGDNLWLHRAIYAAQPGDVLVVSTNETFEYGYWGEIMAIAAQQRGLGGLVLDGCVRDIVLLEEIGFPIFARGLCIRGTGKDMGARGWINAPIRLGRETVRAGDLIVGDRDGVVVIPQERAQEVIDAAHRRDAAEAEIIERLRAGETSLAIYGWD